MTALAADTLRQTRARGEVRFETYAIVTNQTVYVGGLAALKAATARVQAAAASTSLVKVVGVIEQIVNDSGAAISSAKGNTAGTVKARIAYGHEALFAIRTAARTTSNVNLTFLVSDDNTVDGTAAGTALVRCPVGTLVQFEPAGVGAANGWISIRNFGTANASG